jgi:hypothetical protein
VRLNAPHTALHTSPCIGNTYSGADIMLGRPRDIDDTDILDASAVDGFFGDEAAAANALEVHELRQRVEHVEAQISSQFTSLATYAQISQEQVELARSEARAATERSEQRITSLVERERADRISSFTGEAPAGTAPHVTARLDALEHSVAQIRKSVDDCLLRQKALADAITSLFERLAPAAGDLARDTVRSDEPLASFPPPSLPTPAGDPIVERTATSPLSGPIADLSLNG